MQSSRAQAPVARLQPTRVVNLYKEAYDVYIGRENRKLNLPRSPFCNPNALADKSAAERWNCVMTFKSFFLSSIELRPGFRDQVLALQGKRLGCFCKPKLCHGDIIAEWVDAQHGISNPARLFNQENKPAIAGIGSDDDGSEADGGEGRPVPGATGPVEIKQPQPVPRAQVERLTILPRMVPVRSKDLVYVCVIGSAGRKEDAPRMNKQVYEWMCDKTMRVLRDKFHLDDPSRIVLVSGGSAWSDGVAVSLYLDPKHKFAGLECYLAADIARDTGYAKSTQPGRRLRDLHAAFSRHVGRDTMQELVQARDDKRGTALLVYDPERDGFHARNTLVAKRCQYMIAFTWEFATSPKAEGGTADTWKKCTGRRIHIPLQGHRNGIPVLPPAAAEKAVMVTAPAATATQKRLDELPQRGAMGRSGSGSGNTTGTETAESRGTKRKRLDDDDAKPVEDEPAAKRPRTEPAPREAPKEAPPKVSGDVHKFLARKNQAHAKQNTIKSMFAKESKASKASPETKSPVAVEAKTPVATIQDPRGRVLLRLKDGRPAFSYVPNFLDARTADELCEWFFVHAPWKQEAIKLKATGQYVMQPRMSCAYSDGGTFTYRGLTIQPTAHNDKSRLIADRIEAIFGVRPSYFLGNNYRDVNDEIHEHSDDMTDLDPTMPIFGLNLGATRRFVVRHPLAPKLDGKRREPRKALLDLPLEHGSLYVMWPGMQQEMVHSIPAVTTRQEVAVIANGPYPYRINWTCRFLARDAEATAARQQLVAERASASGGAGAGSGAGAGVVRSS